MSYTYHLFITWLTPAIAQIFFIISIHIYQFLYANPIAPPYGKNINNNT
jgi:hypothetical protein